MKCVLTTISAGVDISEDPGCNLLQQRSPWWGSQKLLQGLMSYELTESTFLNLTSELNETAILSKGRKPDIYKWRNSKTWIY